MKSCVMCALVMCVAAAAAVTWGNTTDVSVQVRRHAHYLPATVLVPSSGDCFCFVVDVKRLSYFFGR